MHAKYADVSQNTPPHTLSYKLVATAPQKVCLQKCAVQWGPRIRSCSERALSARKVTIDGQAQTLPPRWTLACKGSYGAIVVSNKVT